MVYKIEPLDLNALLLPVCAASTALARLDERLARSPVRDGFIERQHFADATAALWLEGELVHVEDLVLHDAHMDIRTPTHELTRAHGVLRTRRQIFGNKPDWALGTEGMRTLTRRGRAAIGLVDTRAEPASGADEQSGAPVAITDAGNQEQQQAARLPLSASTEADDLTRALDAMDAVLARSAKMLDGQKPELLMDRPRTPDRPELVYDLDWDEGARLTQWQDVIAATRKLPVVLRAAILIDAWGEIEVLQHATWLGPLLVGALLRQDGIAAHHLPSFSFGAKQVPRERRRAPDRTARLTALIEAIHQTATLGLKEHDRLILAKGQMERRLGQKRTHSRLPDLIDFALSRPLISSAMVQEALKVSKQGALNLIAELGLREITGRGRFRAWGVA